MFKLLCGEQAAGEGAVIKARWAWDQGGQWLQREGLGHWPCFEGEAC